MPWRKWKRELDGGGGFLEQPAKRGLAGDGFFIEDLLLRLAQVVRLPDAFDFQEMAILGQIAMMDERLGHVVGKLNPLQVEEDQMLVDGGPLFARAREQGPMTRVLRLGCVQQAGVDGGFVHQFRQAFQLAHGRE